MLAPKATSSGVAFRKSARACAGAGDDRVGLRAGREGPVGIGVVMQQVVGHRLDDRAGHLRAAGAVEVGDGLAIVPPLQGREVGADLVHRGDAGLAGCGD